LRSRGLVGVHDSVVMEGRLLKHYGYGRLEGDIGTLVVSSSNSLVPTESSEGPRIEDGVLGCDLCSSSTVLWAFVFRRTRSTSKGVQRRLAAEGDLVLAREVDFGKSLVAVAMPFDRSGDSPAG
jgi:hypothetical protein